MGVVNYYMEEEEGFEEGKSCNNLVVVVVMVEEKNKNKRRRKRKRKRKRKLKGVN